VGPTDGLGPSMSRNRPEQVGRYRHIYSADWAQRDFQGLSPNARLVYLCLRTGTQSNLAGIGYVYLEALEQETGLDRGALAAALSELEKQPTPNASWIVREGSIVWVRRHMKDSPTREIDPNMKNERHITAINRLLGTLPRDSVLLKKFRRYNKIPRDRVSDTSSYTQPHRVSHEVPLSPEKEIGEREKDSGDRKRRGGAREGEGTPDPPAVAHRTNPEEFSLSSGSDGTAGRTRTPPPPYEVIQAREAARAERAKAAELDDGDRAIAIVAHVLATRAGKGAPSDADYAKAKRLLVEEGARHRPNQLWCAIAPIVVQQLNEGGHP
jgi:hypothetical protein